MNRSELLHYETLLLAKRDELATGERLVDSITTADPHGDPVDLAASNADTAVQVRLKQTGSKLTRAIDDALKRIRQERFGVCEQCGQPISKTRLEAVPWARDCRDCKEQKESQ